MELKSVLEALLFSSQKPLTPAELRDLLEAAAAEAEEPGPALFRKTSLEQITAALETLTTELEAASRTFRLTCVAGAWQFVSRAEYGPWLRSLLGVKPRPPRLSAPALETLAIVAYRQPITRGEMEQIRGVSVDGVVQTLVERGLIEVTGRAEVIGRPSTYGTTALFLEYFGLRSLEDLPAADELRRLPIQKPPSLLTVDPGLATAPPPDLAQISLPLDAAPPTSSAPSSSPDAAPTS
jgi:segregation and condensation protein B